MIRNERLTAAKLLLHAHSVGNDGLAAGLGSFKIGDPASFSVAPLKLWQLTSADRSPQRDMVNLVVLCVQASELFGRVLTVREHPTKAHGSRASSSDEGCSPYGS